MPVTFESANADFVTDFLAVGGDLAADPAIAATQALELYFAGITHVLDVRRECDDARVWECLPPVTHRWDGIEDAGQLVPATWFEGIFEWALEGIANGGVVLTHCHMGVNRGPSAGFAVLLGLGWDPVEALTAIRTARPIAAILYAEDAVEWHLARTGASFAEEVETVLRVSQWRAENPLDMVGVIRSIRRAEDFDDRVTT